MTSIRVLERQDVQEMAGELFHTDGQRKYLTQEERARFLAATEQFPCEVQTFCYVLTYTGCRPAEARALSADRIDLKAHTITFETVKKRQTGIFRTVPVPPDLIKMLDFAHNLRKAQQRKDRGKAVQLWTWSEATTWRKVKEVMEAADISGVQASAKGLRHGFGVAAVQASIPLNLVQRWLGHAQLSTTAIYAEAVGKEEHDLVARMWG
jgi:integrase/recombinase XerD